MCIENSTDTTTLFNSAKAFASWLKQHRATPTGLRLKIAKRGADEATVTYLEAVEIAFCWGWIDSQKEGLDGHYFFQRFTLRRPRSVWSKVNFDKVAALIQVAACRHPAWCR